MALRSGRMVRSAVSSAPPRRPGSAPSTAATRTRWPRPRSAQTTPTKCQARTRLYRNGDARVRGLSRRRHQRAPGRRGGRHLARPARPRPRGPRGAAATSSGCTRWPSRTPCSTAERPKLDRYRTHLFLTAYGARLDAGDRRAGHQRARRVHHPPGADHHPQGRRTGHRRRRRPLGRQPDLAQSGVGYLLHGLLDYMVDGHFDAVQSLDDAVEALEDQLFADDPQVLRGPAAQLPAAQEPGAAAPGRAARCARWSTR